MSAKAFISAGTILLVMVCAAFAQPTVRPDPLSQEYQNRLAETPETPAGHVELARWCRRQQLPEFHRLHLLQAVQLEPGFGPAMRELGYTRVGELWLAPPPRAEATAPPADNDGDEETRQQKIARYTTWLRGVYHSQLNTSSDSLFNSGARIVMSIHDPDVTFPMASALGGGQPRVRSLLAEALGQIPGPEAQVQLIALGLLEDDRDVLEGVATNLAMHDPDEVSADLVRALEIGDEVMIRNAAVLIGRLNLRPAVPALAGALTDQRVRGLSPTGAWREMRRRYLTWLARRHDIAPTQMLQYGLAPSRINEHPPQPTENERADNRVLRTEVQEALIEITGENFGFAAEPYLQWFGDQQQAEDPLGPLPSLE